MRIRPALFAWQKIDVCVDGGEIRSVEAMMPVGRFAVLCARQYALGEQYALGPVEDIPGSSRAGFFAEVGEAWKNLPEEDETFPTREHLRKRALVAAGWATHAQYVLDTPKDARQMALALRKSDEYAVITVSANVVEVYIAKSIAGGQISAEKWREVKPLALAFVAKKARTTVEELERHSEDGGAR